MTSSFIITGFLGVGKTTMLTNSVKEHFKDKNIAIIVNEFGDVGVDSKILKNVHSEVLEISEGCICCQLAEELEAGVTEIVEKYKPDIIFVETSGASEPFPIFLSLQNLGISIDGVICIVDSKNFDSYKENSTSNYQIGSSNVIILNKTDLVTPEELAKLEKDIEAIKEEYNIRNTLTQKPIFNNHVIFKAQQGIVNAEVFEGVYQAEDVANIAKDFTHLDHTHKDNITQKAVYLVDDITFGDVDEILKNLPKNIYRVKGIVKTKDVPNPIFINYSFGDATFDEMPDYKDKSILIFIGTNVQEQVAKLTNRFTAISSFSV